MGLPLYLAITAPELSTAEVLPKHLAYMACVLSPYSTGLSNYPQSLPEGAVLILNDSTPAGGHDPKLIGGQTAEISRQFGCSGILLDFQRPDNALTFQIAEEILSSVSYPVAVSEDYARELDCPVFLSAPPADCRLDRWLSPWKDREIWLEAALDARTVTLDKTGSWVHPANPCDPDLLPHRSQQLHCHYKTEVASVQVHFTLQRTKEDLKAQLQEAESLGVTMAVGLYQELGFPF